MGDMINISCPDGSTANGYLAPATGEAGVVVVQEWWGLNDQIKSVADRLAEAGFTALAPDLYKGRVTAEEDEANHMMEGLDWAAATDQELRGAVRYLKDVTGKVAVMGFCLGGALVVAAGVRVPEADAGVCFYGIPPIEIADPAKLRIPFQGHFANDDWWCTPETVDALEKTLKGTEIVHEIYRYDAKHAFFNEEDAAIYDASASAQAWDRSLAFLRAQLA